jgi:hypothetical protein
MVPVITGEWSLSTTSGFVSLPPSALASFPPLLSSHQHPGRRYDDLTPTSPDALSWFQQFNAANMVAAERGAFVLFLFFFPFFLTFCSSER